MHKIFDEYGGATLAILALAFIVGLVVTTFIGQGPFGKMISEYVMCMGSGLPGYEVKKYGKEI